MSALSRCVLPVRWSGSAGLCVCGGLSTGDQGSASGGDRVSVRETAVQLWSRWQSEHSIQPGKGRKLPL